MTLNIVGKRYWWFALSLLIILPGLFFLVTSGLKLSIDFTGGTLWEMHFTQPKTKIEPAAVKDVLAQFGYGDAQVQTVQNNGVQIRMKELKEGSSTKDQIQTALQDKFGPIDQPSASFESVGPTLGTTIRNRAIIAVGIASIGILLYIAYAFRKTHNPFAFGICALLAMLHDVAVVVGIFAFLGWWRGVEVDSLFVTALLTVIGFSVHDTIVVFDRIRENLARPAGRSFEEVVNYSLDQTLVRSLNTSLTVIFTLLALFLLGGTTIKYFVLALLIGIVSGTYSSIFNASQLLVVWENRELQHFIARIRGRSSQPARGRLANR